MRRLEIDMTIDQRISAKFAADNGFPLEPHLIVLALMGSHSHGTYMPPEEPDAVDDVDLMGFVVPPVQFHIGLPRWEHWRLQVNELDVVMSIGTTYSGYSTASERFSRPRRPRNRLRATRTINSSGWRRSIWSAWPSMRS